MRKGKQARNEMVKDVNGQILRNGVAVRRRWVEYFEHDECGRSQGSKYKCSW